MYHAGKLSSHWYMLPHSPTGLRLPCFSFQDPLHGTTISDAASHFAPVHPPRPPSIYLPIASPQAYGRASRLITAASREPSTPSPPPRHDLSEDDVSYPSFIGDTTDPSRPWLDILRPRNSRAPYNTPASGLVRVLDLERESAIDHLIRTFDGILVPSAMQGQDSLPLPRFSTVRTWLKQTIEDTGIGKPVPSLNRLQPNVRDIPACSAKHTPNTSTLITPNHSVSSFLDSLPVPNAEYDLDLDDDAYSTPPSQDKDDLCFDDVEWGSVDAHSRLQALRDYDSDDS